MARGGIGRPVVAGIKAAELPFYFTPPPDALPRIGKKVKVRKLVWIKSKVRGLTPNPNLLTTPAS